MQKIHVLSLIGDLGHGGGQNRLMSLARTMDRDRFKQSVVVLNQPNPTSDGVYGSMRLQFESLGIEVHDLGKPLWQSRTLSRPMRLGSGLRLTAGLVSRLRSLISELEVDVIDAHLMTATVVGALAGKASGVPVAATDYNTRTWEGRLGWFAGQLCWGICSAIITDSSVRKDEMDRWIWLPSPTFLVSPNGIPVPVSKRSPAEVRQQFKIPPDPGVRVMAQISRLVEYKGHYDLLKAAQLVFERDPNVYLLIVGFPRPSEPDYPEMIRQQARDLGISDRVRVAGYHGPIEDVWQIIDVHVHASWFDSMPNAIIEGMALGKPAVVTAVGGIPDMVTNEKTGLVVAPRDPGRTAEAVLRLLGDRELCDSLGRAARTRYEERCRPETMARAIEHLFEQLARKKGEGRAARRET